MAKWVNLPQDILNQIAQRARDTTCFVRLKSVCRSWKSATRTDTHQFQLSQTPWLLLFQRSDDKKFFLSPSPVTLVRVADPELYYNLDIQSFHPYDLEELVGCTGSWLIKFDDETMTLLMMNPFTQVVESDHLPPLLSVENLTYNTHPHFGSSQHETVEHMFVQKVVLSSTSTTDHTTSNAMAAAILNIFQSAFLAFAKPGSNKWTLTRCTSKINPCCEELKIHDAIFYMGYLWAVNELGEVFICDYTREKTLVLGRWFQDEVYSWKSIRGDRYSTKKHYLVEVMGGLVLVLRLMVFPSVSSYPYIRKQKFKVFKLDFRAEKAIPIRSLGNYSLFLGLNTSVALPASESSAFRKNCIYVTDDYKPNPLFDVSVFDLENGKMRPFRVNGALSLTVMSPPIWVIPSSVTSELN